MYSAADLKALLKTQLATIEYIEQLEKCDTELKNGWLSDYYVDFKQDAWKHIHELNDMSGWVVAELIDGWEMDDDKD